MEFESYNEAIDMVDYTILKNIEKSETPIGSWVITELLEINGINLSTATIGRKLRALDIKGYTVKLKNQGRELTKMGREYLLNMEEELHRNKLRADAIGATKITELSQLLELLTVRKLLEVESVRQASVKATEEDIQRLFDALNAHKTCVALEQDPTEPALKFHTIIAKISHNEFLFALLNLLSYEERRIEKQFETLVTRTRGNEYIIEHENIAKSIADGNSDLAVRLMDEHLGALISAIKEQP